MCAPFLVLKATSCSHALVSLHSVAVNTKLPTGAAMNSLCHSRQQVSACPKHTLKPEWLLHKHINRDVQSIASQDSTHTTH